MNDDEIKKITETYVKKIAEQLCFVQPMPSDTFKKLYEHSKTTEELVENGFKPVSNLGLLWIKEN